MIVQNNYNGNFFLIFCSIKVPLSKKFLKTYWLIFLFEKSWKTVLLFWNYIIEIKLLKLHFDRFEKFQKVLLYRILMENHGRISPF